MLENASRVGTIDNWLPYDIAKTGEDEYSITMAAAGFSQDELSDHDPEGWVRSG